MLENKLAWSAGSIDTILAGGEPKALVMNLQETSHGTRSHSGTEVVSRASSEALLLELRRRIIRSHHRPHEGSDDWDDGLDPHGSWPDER